MENQLRHQFLDAEELAQALRCSVSTVEEQTRKGLLPGIKIGTGWIYPYNKILEVLEKRAEIEAEARWREQSMPQPVAVYDGQKWHKTPPRLPDQIGVM